MAVPAPTRLHLYTDGASQGNPGPSAAAWMIIDPVDDRVLSQGALFLGVGTNNVAEYTAIVRGLEDCIAHHFDAVQVLSDSKLCIDQINGDNKVSKPHLKKLHAEVLRLKPSFKDIQFIWVRRENEWTARCDEMAGEAIGRHAG